MNTVVAIALYLVVGIVVVVVFERYNLSPYEYEWERNDPVSVGLNAFWLTLGWPAFVIMGGLLELLIGTGKLLKKIRR